MSNWESAKTIQTSAAKTSTGVGDAVDLGTRDRLLRQTLDVTAAAGTLTARLESSADGVTGWRTFGTFTAFTAVGAEKLSFVSPDRYVRVAWTITGGTPSFTFAVSGTLGLCFANLDQLDAHGLIAAATAKLTMTKKVEALAAVTEIASATLAIRYDPPLETWGIDLTQAVCKVAAYDLLSVRGFSPDGNDRNIRARYDDANKWFSDVANAKIDPIGISDSEPDDDDIAGGIEVVTHEPRGWR